MSAIQLILYITDRDPIPSPPAQQAYELSHILTAGYNSDWHKERAIPKLLQQEKDKKMGESKDRVKKRDLVKVCHRRIGDLLV